SLSQLRMSLKKIGLGENWTSEIDLKRLRAKRLGRLDNNFLVPDGIFVSTSNGTPIVTAVELELHAKGHGRYKKLFSRYARKDSIDIIWYFVASEAMRKTIARQWQKTRRFESSPSLIFSILSDVILDPSNAKIYRAKGGHLKIDDIFDVKI